MLNFKAGWMGALQVDLRIRLGEVPSGRRPVVRARQLVKYSLAALLHFAGLTGPLLRRGLRTGKASLILGFHGVSEEPPRLFSRGHSLAYVESQLRWLKRHLQPVPLEEIAEAVARGEAPPRGCFAVTFDDGLVNNVKLALPLLKELGIPATFFVPSGLVGLPLDLWISALRETISTWRGARIEAEPGLWPDLPVGNEEERYAAFMAVKQALKTHERRRLEVLERLAARMGQAPRVPEEDRVVDREALQEMARPGFSVGAHSRTHPILSALEPDAARVEIEGSRRDLEQMLGRAVVDFAYPNGRFPDFSDVTCRLVAEAGFRCALTTEPGTVRRGDDRLALRRCLPGNVPVFLVSFELLMRAWADRRRPADLPLPVRGRRSYLARRQAGSIP